MGKKDRIRPPKPCDICSKEADVQFRIQTNESGNWRIVCVKHAKNRQQVARIISTVEHGKEKSAISAYAFSRAGANCAFNVNAT